MAIFKGKTVEEAIKRGLKELNIPKEKAHIQIKQTEKKGILGIGAKEARVEIEPIAQHIKDQADRSAVRGVPEEVQAKAETVKSASEATVELSQVVQAVKLAEEQAKTTGEKADVEMIKKEVLKNKTITENVKGLTEEMPIVKELTSDLSEETTAEETSEEQGLDDSKTILELSKYLTKITKELGAPALVKVSREEGGLIVFDLESNKQGLIIGKHGKILNALQYLAQVFVHRFAKNKLSVVVNIGDYRNKRKLILEKLAKKTAEQAKKTGQPVFLEPMPAYERKQIHSVLSEDPYISTHSEGDDPYRYLVVEKNGRQI